MSYYSSGYEVIYELDVNGLYDHSYYVGIYDKTKTVADSPDGSLLTRHTAVVVSMMTEEQDIFNPLRFITHKISLVSSNQTGAVDWLDVLERNDDDKYQIVTDQSGNETRTFINIEDIEYPLLPKPYDIKYEGYEGFHILERNEITDINGNTFTGKVTIMQVIVGALNKLPHTGFYIKVASSILDDNMSDSYSFMSQTYIDAESLYDDGELISCLEAIRRLIEPFGLVLVSYDYDWYFLHVSEANRNDLPVYSYNYAGTFSSKVTRDNIIELTNNTVSPANKYGWINANAVRKIITGYNSIKIETNRTLKHTTWQYSWFKTYETKVHYGETHTVPEKWSPGGVWQVPSVVSKYTTDRFQYAGEYYYPMKLDYHDKQIGLGNDGIGEIISGPSVHAADNIWCKVLGGVQPGMKIIIVIYYRLDHYYQNKDNYTATFHFRLRHKKINSGVTTYVHYNASNNSFQSNSVKNEITTNYSNEYKELKIEASLGGAIDDGSILQIFLSQPYDLERSDGTVTTSEKNSTALIVKNIDIAFKYFDSYNEQDYIKVPETQYESQIITNKLTKGEYNKTLYYSDVKTTDNTTQSENIQAKSYDNNFFWLDGTEYKPTSDWNYDTSGRSATTIQQLLLSDLYKQYATDVLVISGDLLAYNFNMLNIIQDNNLFKLFMPLNYDYDLKASVLRSAEFMENKLSLPEDIEDSSHPPYLVDESGQPILDESGGYIEYV